MSSSLADLMHENEGDQFTFNSLGPDQPPFPSSGGSSDSTPPYLARTLPERGSSTSTSSHRRHRKHDNRRRDAGDADDPDDSSPRLLSRLVSRLDQRDVKHIRTLLIITNDRLESETRRADQAEQRVVDALHRLRSANEATTLAQADATRARQESQMHSMRLEQARYEISRIQEHVEQLQQSQRDAEDEAARARTVARKLREELVSSKAREEGRKEGYAEGLARGRMIGLAEAQGSTVDRKLSVSARPTPRRSPVASVQTRVDERLDNESVSDDIPPIPVPIRRRQSARPPSAPIPHVHRMTSPVRNTPSPTRNATTRPPSARPRAPERVPDVAPIAQTLPIPTITTPLNAPSPSHVRPSPPLHRQSLLHRHTHSPKISRTPAAASPPRTSVPSPAPAPSHVPTPAFTSLPTPFNAPVLTPAPSPSPPNRPDPPPILVHNVAPSPRHPPMDIPPDVWIPYAASNDSKSILVPPPHEFSRPVSPVETGENGVPKPPPSEEMGSPEETYAIPVPPPDARHIVMPRSPEMIRQYPPSVQSRDYAHGGAPLPMKAPSSVMNTPQSRPSTLSQYDLLGPPKHEMVYRQGVDRETIMAGQGPPDRTPMSLRSVSTFREDRGNQPSYAEMYGSSYRKKRSHSKAKGKERELEPIVMVQSPTTPSSSRRLPSAVEPPEPNFLSPEDALRPLPMFDSLPIAAPQSPLPVPPPVPPKQVPFVPSSSDSQSVGGRSGYQASRSYRSRTPGMYAEAPLPDGLVYPSPPGRPKSRASARTGGAPVSEDGTLSPISLGKPFSSFGMSN